MSKQEEAGLILKLYELRPKKCAQGAKLMAMEFNPQSIEILTKLFLANTARTIDGSQLLGNGLSLVNERAIDAQLFNDANGSISFTLQSSNHFSRASRKEWNAHSLSAPGKGCHGYSQYRVST